MSEELSLRPYGIQGPEVLRNGSVSFLYEHAILYDEGSHLADSGALIVRSGEKTGRSPKDKRIVAGGKSQSNVWWGAINVEIDASGFQENRSRAIHFLNSLKRVYVFDGFAGWDPKHRIKVRVVTSRPYHALFMHNMLIRPTPEELNRFGSPDYVIFNAGEEKADEQIPQVLSKTCVALDIESGEFVILGTEYAGEMKKGIFTVMNYIMPERGVLSMHCSANEGPEKDVSLFFGLSGTGKTTLSADPARRLIGDDEHCWSEDGIFNIEGGCYAKAIHLSAEKEPQIYDAIRYGTVLENVIYDPQTRQVHYDEDAITENTRASYPIEFIDNAKIPSVGPHPKHIILLTCDAFGVLPPVSRLNPPQAMYHFISGYTAKVAGTEMGVTEPEATFSACFGAAFLVWHPGKYAELLAEKMRNHNSSAWLVNTGWSGGSYGVGSRISLPHTRAIIDAIHSGALDPVPTQIDPIFGFEVPTQCPDIPSDILIPQNTWADKEAFNQAAQNLARLFQANFESFREGCSPEIISAGPRLSENG